MAFGLLVSSFAAPEVVHVKGYYVEDKGDCSEDEVHRDQGSLRGERVVRGFRFSIIGQGYSDEDPDGDELRGKHRIEQEVHLSF